MDIEITKLEAACLVLAKAIEDGRIEGIQNEVRELLNYNLVAGNKTQDWEERFARKFCVMIERSGYTDEEVEEIYKFINKEIDSQKQELLKEVLKITDKGFDCVCDGTIRSKFNTYLRKI